jgi:hypothetical protein
MKENKIFLVRDKYSKAILNTNADEVKEYNNKKQKDNKIIKLECEINSIKKQLEEIKNLLIEKNK